MNFVAYTIIDSETGERYQTTDYESRAHVDQLLALAYVILGDDCNLSLAGITPDGKLHKIETEDK